MMKKLILVMAGSLLISLTVVYAQEDTTRNKDQAQQENRYRTEEMVAIPVEDIPDAVMETLKNPTYTGWEKRAVYLDPEKGEYVIEIERVDALPIQYRFDRSGRDITDEEQQEDKEDQDRKSKQDQDDRNQYFHREMVVIEVNDIPVAVVETLKDPKYEGWEKRAVYLDPETGDYVVEVEKINTVPKKYHIDKSGKEVRDRGKQKKDKY